MIVGNSECGFALPEAEKRKLRTFLKVFNGLAIFFLSEHRGNHRGGAGAANRLWTGFAHGTILIVQ